MARGWLKEYVESHQGLFLDIALKGRRTPHPDFSLYKVIQPTGLMYGQPVSRHRDTESTSGNMKDKMKIMLAESLIGSSILFHDRSLRDLDEVSEVMMKTIDRISIFYTNVFPEMATSPTTLFGRKKTSLELAEQILEKRIDCIDAKGNFWTGFFQNSLLFLDIFIFGQWIHTNADKIVSDFFKYEREELRISLVKVMALAAHANHTLEQEEKKLLDYFLRIAQLPPAKKKECRDIFEQGISMEDLNLQTNNSWILKKYYLEIAILTLWADKRVEETELLFLRSFADAMAFSNEDVENSMLAVEGFLLENWSELDLFHDKKSDNQDVGKQYVDRMARLAARHKDRLMKEVKSANALVAMLTKARTRELDDEEKMKLKEMLVEVLGTIPTFAIVSLPHRFLTLPIIMQILPKNFMVETFND